LWSLDGGHVEPHYQLQKRVAPFCGSLEILPTSIPHVVKGTLNDLIVRRDSPESLKGRRAEQAFHNNVIYDAKPLQTASMFGKASPAGHDSCLHRDDAGVRMRSCYANTEPTGVTSPVDDDKRVIRKMILQ